MLLALDTETTGLTWDDSPFLMSYAYENYSGAMEIDEAFVTEGSTYIFHNAKFDLRMLIKAGVLRREDITIDSFHDTQILAQMIDENRSLKLKDLAKSVLGEETDEAEVVRMWRRKLKLKKTDGYDKLPREVVIPYAIKDAEFTLALFHHFIAFPFSKKLYDRERQVVLDVLDLESNGLGVDREYAESMRKGLNSKCLIGLNRITRLVGVEDFNPGSTKQLAEALSLRGIELPLTPKKNPKTDNATLIQFEDHLIDLVLEYRKNMKLLHTYIEAILRESETEPGILHPNFNPFGAKTGRFSSSSARE